MGSTAYVKINNALSGYDIYNTFRRGEVNVDKYQKWVQEEGHPAITLLNQDQINLSARCPRNRHEFVYRALAQCKALDILDDDDYEAETIDQTLSKIDNSYEHRNFLTFIFPEESALLHAVTLNARPRRAVFMGSYYGYWAAAAKSACPDMHVTLLDINQTVMDLAKHNFEKLGLAHGVDFTVGDAETTAVQLKEVDLLVLDAEGPKSDEVPEDYRDKAIYYPHLKAALANLAPGALLVAHNVILSNFTHGPYFEEKQLYYRKQYTKFLPLVRANFTYTLIDSTEGTLIARKK